MLQSANGSPSYPDGHEQTGTWLMTLHIALDPHEPRHGSTHFILIQALSLLQSVLITHSGLQFGGLPKNPKIQEHDGIPPISLHSAFSPQGDGKQGFMGSLGGSGSGTT